MKEAIGMRIVNTKCLFFLIDVDFLENVKKHAINERFIHLWFSK